MLYSWLFYILSRFRLNYVRKFKYIANSELFDIEADAKIAKLLNSDSTNRAY